MFLHVEMKVIPIQLSKFEKKNLPPVKPPAFFFGGGLSTKKKYTQKYVSLCCATPLRNDNFFTLT